MTRPAGCLWAGSQVHELAEIAQIVEVAAMGCKRCPACAGPDGLDHCPHDDRLRKAAGRLYALLGELRGSSSISSK